MEIYDPAYKHCSLGDQRSWVEPVHNLAYLNDVQLEKNLHRLWDFEAAPLDLLSVFLHETTHHWCFTSPVGSTLAYLQLRARRRAFSLVDRDEDSPDKDLKLFADLLDGLMGIEDKRYCREEIEMEISEDVIRFETAVHLLRPLAEGLALFAEHDIISRRASVRSTVLNRMFEFFAFRDYVSRSTVSGTIIMASSLVDSALGEMLYQMRTGEEGLRRKENVLSQSITAKDGGYLLGYLTVKRLWRVALQKCHRVRNETDLFLMFLRSFIYNDYGLVSALLNPNTQGVDSVNAILERLRERMIEFDRIDLEKAIDHFEQAVEQDTEEEYWETMHSDVSRARYGKELLDKLLREEKKDYPLRPDNFLFIYSDSRTLFHRHLMLFGSMDATVQVDADGQVTVLRDSTPFFTARATEDFTPGTGEGSLDLYFSTKAFGAYRVIVISLSSKIVSIIARGTAEKGSLDHLIQELKEYIEPRRGIEFNDTFGFKALNQVLNQIIDRVRMSMNFDDIRQQVNDITEDLYSDIALARVPEDKLHLCRQALQEGGIYKILNEDFSLMRSLALISNCCSVLPQKIEIEELFRVNYMDLDASLVDLEKCTRQYGLPEVVEHNGYLFSHV